jgi:hypothetical protein
MILKINSHYSLYTVNMLVFLIDTDCVLCQVGPNFYMCVCVCACVRVLPTCRACVHIYVYL